MNTKTSKNTQCMKRGNLDLEFQIMKELAITIRSPSEIRSKISHQWKKTSTFNVERTLAYALNEVIIISENAEGSLQ